MEAAKHAQENERLAALRRYDILDTPREADFDAIVNLASRICEAPISVINLIDAERQWFKAEVGLGVRETPLETSICAHAILEQDYVEIPDTLHDARMRDNALCLGDPGLRFYAGALLRSPEGLPIGTLCVLDHKPRQLDELQRLTLVTLAAQVVTQLNLRAALARKAVLRKEIDHRVKNSLQSV
ncbi:MAG: GAF domain-containing protein, partial [Sphingomonadaceae bacterium]